MTGQSAGRFAWSQRRKDTRVSRGSISAAGEQLTCPRLPTRVGERFHPPPAVSVTRKDTRGSRKAEPTFARQSERLFVYFEPVTVEYREEPCRSALNRVKGMRFDWSLNPYMGCAHRCTFCYVRAFERRADRPSDDRYGTSIRVKINIAEVLRRELARPSWEREQVAIGAATDPYQPAEGRYRLTRACIEALAEARNPFGIITRGPMIVRDIDVLAEAARRAERSVNFSMPTLDQDVWRKTEPATAPPRQRLRAVSMLVRGRDQGRSRHGADPARNVRQADPNWPKSCAQHATPARPASGRTCCTCGPARASTSSSSLARDWPEELRALRAPLRKARLPWQGAHETAQDQVTALAKEYGVRDRRGIRLEPEPPVIAEQLALV